jgi:hypothetical protein
MRRVFFLNSSDWVLICDWSRGRGKEDPLGEK